MFFRVVSAERLMDDVAYMIGLRPTSPFLEEVLRYIPFTEPKNNFRLAASAGAGGVPAASSGIATVKLKGTSQDGGKDSMGLGKLSGAAFVDLTDNIDLGFSDGKTFKGDSEKFQFLRGKSSSKNATIKPPLENLKRAANEVVEIEKSEERKRNDKQPDLRVQPASILEDWGDAAKEKKKGKGNEKGNNFVFDVLKALKGNDVDDDDIAASAGAGGVPAASSGIATVTLKGTSQDGGKDSMGLGKLSGAAFVDLTDNIDLGFPDGKTFKGDSEKFQFLHGKSSSKNATIKPPLGNLKRAANEVVEIEKSEERKRNDKQPDLRVLPASILEDWGDAAKEKKKGEGNEKGNNFVFDVLKALKGNDVDDDDIDLENASFLDIAKARAITFPRPRWNKE